MESTPSGFLDHNCGQSKEERNIGTLAAFSKMIPKKDVTLIVEGCGTECHLCLG